MAEDNAGNVYAHEGKNPLGLTRRRRPPPSWTISGEAPDAEKWYTPQRSRHIVPAGRGQREIRSVQVREGEWLPLALDGGLGRLLSPTASTSFSVRTCDKAGNCDRVNGKPYMD
jgi:hypothetical protein